LASNSWTDVRSATSLFVEQKCAAQLEDGDVVRLIRLATRPWRRIATCLASSVKALESALDRKEAHEQQLAEAQHAARQTPMTHLGSERIQR